MASPGRRDLAPVFLFGGSDSSAGFSSCAGPPGGGAGTPNAWSRRSHSSAAAVADLIASNAFTIRLVGCLSTCESLAFSFKLSTRPLRLASISREVAERPRIMRAHSLPSSSCDGSSSSLSIKATLPADTSSIAFTYSALVASSSSATSVRPLACLTRIASRPFIPRLCASLMAISPALVAASSPTRSIPSSFLCRP
jgi:hypothetical protein